MRTNHNRCVVVVDRKAKHASGGLDFTFTRCCGIEAVVFHSN